MTRMGMLFIFEALHNKFKKCSENNDFLIYMGNMVSIYTCKCRK